MFSSTDQPQPSAAAAIPDGEIFHRQYLRRKARAGRWATFFLAANLFAISALVVLFLNIINRAWGYTAVTYAVKPSELSAKPLDELNRAELETVLLNRLDRNRLRVLVRDNVLGKNIDPARLSKEPISQLFAGKQYPPEIADKTFSQVTKEEAEKLLALNLDEDALRRVLLRDVAKPEVVQSWDLLPSVFDRVSIESEVAAKHPGSELVFRSWLSWDFVTRELSSSPSVTGLRTALVGSLWVIVLTILISLPLGIGAAIYLEEYATKNWINTLIEINIRNLAGVPSIIYGMLGLAVFVRTFGYYTSGEFLGITDSNGRTVISAALTMSLLILPVVIINAQEAIRAVPNSIREASYGVGATRWQTVWRQVLPAATPGILTGLILSVSRAVGETAPLIVVGGLTFMTIDPNGPFSKFSVIPIQVFSWTAEPRPEFRNVAAAAILVLLIMLLGLNTIAIITRQRLSKKLRGA